MRQGSSATFEELLSKAKPLLESAVRNDRNENKLEAVRCYVEGIELLLNAIESKRNHSVPVDSCPFNSAATTMV